MEINDEGELVAAVHEARMRHLPILILGGGSNMLMSGDWIGVVLKINIKGVFKVSQSDSEVLLSVGAGEVWHNWVMYAVQKGYGGIENMALIPGTVGAAPMQNIGAYGVELKDSFDSVTGYNLETGDFETYYAADCEFGYRTSIFKTRLAGKFVITKVNFRLSVNNHTLHLDYGAIRDELSKMGVSEPGIADVANAVIAIRKSKLPDPAIVGNAGSFFKNPVISAEIADSLKIKFPNLPVFDAASGFKKLSAAFLIESCGWKGKIYGNTGTYKNHSLVLVNHGNASGAEIIQLAKDIQASVHKKFGVEIEAEVNWV